MTGASIRIELDDAAVRRGLNDLDARGRDLSPAMDEIGAMLVSSTIRRFETETDPDGRPWKPSERAVATGGQTLTDESILRASFSYEFGPNFVEAGTDVVYAAIHQFGGQAGRGLAATIPERPFLGVDAGDEAEIVAIIGEHLNGFQ